MFHRLAAALAACALVLTLTVPVLAGGWADIVADAGTTDPPVEGQPIDIGFRVLQHGVTPAPWETATVHFQNASTGRFVDVVATNDRADGHFVATATLPEAGGWTWQVTLKDLQSTHAPVPLRVIAASGASPAQGAAATSFPVQLLVAALLIATAVLAMILLARRSGARRKVSPAPGGADPA